MDKLLEFLNKIPNVGAFIKDLQDKGLPISIGFDLLTSAGVAMMLLIAISLGSVSATLITSQKTINKVIGFSMLAVAGIILFFLFKQDSSNSNG